MEIYKYLHIKRKDFFEDFRLRFTQPLELNDPYECIPAISDINHNILLDQTFESELNKKSYATKNRRYRRAIMSEYKKAKKPVLKKNEKSDCVQKMFLETYREKVNNIIGIFCLSKRYDSSLMWSHYTDRHKGFVIGFDSDHPFFKQQRDDPPDIGTLEEVRYSTERYEVDLINLNITSELFLIKDEEWRYEEEMRLIRRLSKASQIKETDGSKIYLFDIPKDSISSIIFGINSAEETQQEIRKIVRSDDLLKNVPLFQACMDYKTFKIQTRKIL